MIAVQLLLRYILFHPAKVDVVELNHFLNFNNLQKVDPTDIF